MHETRTGGVGTKGSSSPVRRKRVPGTVWARESLERRGPDRNLRAYFCEYIFVQRRVRTHLPVPNITRDMGDVKKVLYESPKRKSFLLTAVLFAADGKSRRVPSPACRARIVSRKTTLPPPRPPPRPGMFHRVYTRARVY